MWFIIAYHSLLVTVYNHKPTKMSHVFGWRSHINRAIFEINSLVNMFAWDIGAN